MKLVLLTCPEPLPDEHKALDALFAAGLECLHVRKPGYSHMEMAGFVEALSAENREKVVLHAHHDLCLVYKLKGLHFTANMPFDKKQGYEGLQFSRSLHSLEELNGCDRIYDYVFLSPVFESISKKGYGSKFNLETLQPALKSNHSKGGVKVFALGGVDVDTIALAKVLGFDGAGVLGEIWETYKEENYTTNGKVMYKMKAILQACKMLTYVP
jgi:thiamine-phosphate pyrophosphorylase